MSFNLGSYDGFLTIILQLWVLGRKTIEMKCNLVSYQGYMLSRWLTTVDVDETEIFLYSYSFSPLSVQCVLEGITVCHPYLRGRELSFTYLKTEYINNLKFFCVGDLSFFPYVFIYSVIFILVWTHGFSFVFTMENLLFFY